MQVLNQEQVSQSPQDLEPQNMSRSDATKESELLDEDQEKACKRAYVQVDLPRRKKLVELVSDESMTIKEAAKLLNINYSTAKNIVKIHSLYGRIETFPKKKRQKRKSKRKNHKWGNKMSSTKKDKGLVLKIPKSAEREAQNSATYEDESDLEIDLLANVSNSKAGFAVQTNVRKGEDKKITQNGQQPQGLSLTNLTHFGKGMSMPNLEANWSQPMPTSEIISMLIQGQIDQNLKKVQNQKADKAETTFLTDTQMKNDQEILSGISLLDYQKSTVFPFYSRLIINDSLRRMCLKTALGHFPQQRTPGFM